MSFQNLEVVHVVAMDQQRCIGQGNQLPWHISADLKHFKEITSGHTVVMGRTTFESILTRLGKPLPNRRNVVLTRDPAFASHGVEIIHNIEDIRSLGDDIFIIGGAQVYAVTIHTADRLYVTEVHTRIDGDAHFPAIDRAIWCEASRQKHFSDEKNQYAYDFVVYERV